MDEDFIKQYSNEIAEARLNADRQGLARIQEEQFREKEESNSITKQLDLTEEITRIDYLIKGYSLEPNENNELVWKAPSGNDMVIFSEYGIHLIRNTICWYLNKNLLLSNFDEDLIRAKMLSLTDDLIDTIFMEYEKVFLYPSTQDCIELFEARMKKKAEISVYARQLLGINVTIEEVTKEKIKEVEDRIEKELAIIKEQVIKAKLKRFLLIVRVIQDAVHTTYLRAWKGQERITARQHMTVSETRGNLPTVQNKTGGLFPWSSKNK